MNIHARSPLFLADYGERQRVTSAGKSVGAESAPTSFRTTRARGAVIAALQKANGHLDAIHLWSRARAFDPRISLASVYRTLNALLEQGLVRKYLFKGSRAVWESARHEPHAHLVDVASGDVLDIIDKGIHQQLERAARALGYRLVDINIELYGRPLNEVVPTDQSTTQ